MSDICVKNGISVTTLQVGGEVVSPVPICDINHTTYVHLVCKYKKKITFSVVCLFHKRYEINIRTRTDQHYMTMHEGCLYLPSAHGN